MKKCLALVLFFSALTGFAQSDALRNRDYNLNKGVAINGYDPVGYFTEHKALKGKKELASAYHGVIYYFASAADKEAFGTAPSKYEPQYGGWCAYAMGHDGSKVEVDPETFKIIDGKLFLFYNRLFTNTLKSWNLDETKLHNQADANWQKLFPLQPK